MFPLSKLGSMLHSAGASVRAPSGIVEAGLEVMVEVTTAVHRDWRMLEVAPGGVEAGRNVLMEGCRMLFPGQNTPKAALTRLLPGQSRSRREATVLEPESLRQQLLENARQMLAGAGEPVW